MESKHNEVMEGAMSYALVFLALALVAIGLIGMLVFVVKEYAGEVENQTGVLSIEDRCDFVVKTNNFNSVSFGEPTAGTFKYELYATPDGYVEVWKCN